MFREELTTEIYICAPAGRVWSELADLASYPEWNPMIIRADGELSRGERLKVRYEPPGSRGHTYRPKLLVVEPGRELRWLGWPRFPGFFDSEHYWTMDEGPGGETRLLHGAAVFGLLAPLWGKSFLRNSAEPFGMMNLALKERAESAGDRAGPC
jgi:hypothetical protein